MENELYHYGTPRHSGRFPYGSGEEPYQHPYKERNTFLVKYDELKKKYGNNDTAMAKELGMSVDDFRKKRSLATAAENDALRTRAVRLYDKYGSYTKVGQIMGYGDTTVRNWVKKTEDTRQTKLNNTAKYLEDKLKSSPSGILDVGEGVEVGMGITSTTLKTALKSLEDQGYVVNTIKIQQPMDPNKSTTVKYLAMPGTTNKDFFNNRENIGSITDFTPNAGIDYIKTQRPTSLDSSRIKVVYKNDIFNGVENAGSEHDGMIAIRRGCKDITLGNSSYAQIRMMVDGTHYIKGMAVYTDDIPKGYDVIVYSNKKKGTPIKGEDNENSVLKNIKKDPDNPFGANIMAGGQTYYKDSKGKYAETSPGIFELDEKGKLNGNRYSLSPLNKVKDEDDWESYHKQAAAQFLSKQPIKLIKQQLDVTYANAEDRYNEIMSNTNPVVRRKLLNEFAETTEKSARKLEAAPFPGQTNKVILPIPSLKDNEVYAPTYKNGTQLALIRYPHSGPFEIPILTVNNRNAEGKDILKNAPDAIGINKKAAGILSGADFDGDSVLTIPISDKVRIKGGKTLPGLEDFDPSEAYPKYEGMKVISKSYQQKQMGIVTNLITDMTVQNAKPEEIAAAVRHSMVIIDANKHELNWKQSELDNRIDALQRRYQQHPDDDVRKKPYGGASTLLSRLGNATIQTEEIGLVTKDGKRTYSADPETGELHYSKTGKTRSKLIVDKNKNPILDANGNKQYEQVPVLGKYDPLKFVSDAHELSSGSMPEEAYANHINKLRSLCNKARKEALAIETPSRDPSAAKTYAEEVASLNDKLKLAISNKPLERQAQMKSGARINALSKVSPDLKEDKDKWNKTKQRLLREARNEVGAGKQQIIITDKEWKAIQAKAVSGSFLEKVIKNADMDVIRELSTPGQGIKLTTQKANYIKALDNAGFTIAEIAEQTGVSVSTVSKYIK